MKLIRLLASLGYGSRSEVKRLLKAGAFTDDAGEPPDIDRPPPHERLRFRGEPLDPPAPLTLLLHKPTGVTCGSGDPGPLVADLFPERFRQRNPAPQPAGRLDKDSSGLLVVTDDGDLAHRLIHPKSRCPKTYLATLDRPLRGDEAEIFAAGSLMLRSETEPLLPAEMEVVDERLARLTLHEGRYHQVRRMFAAVGNHVTALHRERIGGLALPDDLAPGEWRAATREELAALGVG